MASPNPTIPLAPGSDRPHDTPDDPTFAEIYERDYPRVYAFCRKHTGSAVEAEDLAQETFLQLHRRMHAFEGRSSLLTYTIGISLNLCRRHFRRDQRWSRRERDVAALDERAVDPLTDRRIDAARTLARCAEALETSRQPAHLEIFRMHYVERRSIRSIAKHLGRSDSAVKVSLHRSRVAIEGHVPELRSVLGASDSAA